MKRHRSHIKERTCNHLLEDRDDTVRGDEDEISVPDWVNSASPTEKLSFAGAFNKTSEDIRTSDQPNKLVSDFMSAYADEIDDIARKDVAVSGIYDDNEDYDHHLFMCRLRVRMDIQSKLTEGLDTDFHLKPEPVHHTTNSHNSAHNLGLAAVAIANKTPRDMTNHRPHKPGRGSRLAKRLSDTRKFINGTTGVYFSKFKLAAEKQSQRLVGAGLIQRKFSSDESRIDFVAKRLITDDDKVHLQNLLNEFNEAQSREERSRIRIQLSTVVDKYAKEYGDAKELSRNGKIVLGAAGIALTLAGAFMAAKGYNSLVDRGSEESGNLLDAISVPDGSSGDKIWGETSLADQQIFAIGVEAIHEAYPNLEDAKFEDMVHRTLNLVTKKDEFIGNATGTDRVARGKLFDENFRRLIESTSR